VIPEPRPRFGWPASRSAPKNGELLDRDRFLRDLVDVGSPTDLDSGRHPTIGFINYAHKAIGSLLPGRYARAVAHRSLAEPSLSKASFNLILRPPSVADNSGHPDALGQLGNSLGQTQCGQPLRRTRWTITQHQC
jgi:hypothetical protein